MAEKKQRGGYRQINDALNICAFEDYLDAQHTHLPDIADVEQISPRVIRVLGQNAGKVGHSIVTLPPYFFELLQFCFSAFCCGLVHLHSALISRSLRYKGQIPTSSARENDDSLSIQGRASRNGLT